MLLALGAAAAVLPDVPQGARTIAVLVCPADDTCDPDARFAEGAQGLAEADLVLLDLLLERDNGGWAGGRDTRAVLADAVARAEAAATKGRWAAVAQATAEAKTALAEIRGDVNTQTLVTLWFLDGAAAVERKEDRAQEYALRQAAAMVGDAEVKLPPHPDAVERAWADERRKLVVGGTGSLALSGPDGVRWSVDGVSLGEGVDSLRLLPGNHRVVATLAGTVKSWQGDAPVLAGRTVTVSAAFDDSAKVSWLHARLVEAFDTLQAPPELTSLLADWCARHGLDGVRLVRVERPAPAPRPAGAAIGPADPLRPDAADGERVNHGDGIPSTYAEEVVFVDEAAKDAAPTAGEPRLRVVWFDPALQRFSLDAGTALARPDTEDPRFHVSLHLGYVGMMAHKHAAADIGGTFRVGPVELEARLGLVRADSPYNLYTDWVDQQLYHVAAGVRWAPDWKVAPFVAAGPELYVPVAFGGRVSAGAQVRIERSWLATVEAHGGWLDQGPEWGAGVSVGWGY